MSAIVPNLRRKVCKHFVCFNFLKLQKYLTLVYNEKMQNILHLAHVYGCYMNFHQLACKNHIELGSYNFTFLIIIAFKINKNNTKSNSNLKKIKI